MLDLLHQELQALSLVLVHILVGVLQGRNNQSRSSRGSFGEAGVPLEP